MIKIRTRRDPYGLMRELRLRLQLWIFVLMMIAVIGTVGFRILEDASWLESAYRTVCVLTTLGLTNHPLNPNSTAFAIVLAIAGIGSFAYSASAIARTMISEEFQRSLLYRKALRHMKNLEHHHILVGYGRIGAMVAEQLKQQGLPFVIVERDDARFEQMRESGLLGFHADATQEETLELAGLERARSIIIATASDAENLLITVTARQLSTTIPIVVRCSVESNASKFSRAGATRVVTINTTGAMQIALAATKPYVIDLINLATGSGSQEFELRQMPVPSGSPVYGHSIKDLALGSRFEVIVIGIKRPGQPLQFNPSAQATIAAGDVLITVGREEKFRELEAFLANRKA